MAENETEYDIDVTNEVADAADIIGNAVRAQHDIDPDNRGAWFGFSGEQTYVHGIDS